MIAANGSFVGFEPMPDRYTTNLCFGGPDMRDAFITLSSSGRVVKARWPRPGLKLNFDRPEFSPPASAC